MTLAIVFVHGMGDQWRLASASGLLADLDAYWVQKGGISMTVTPKVDPVLLPDGDRMTYLEATLGTGTRLDMYEVYWAPLTGDGPGPMDVLRWIQAQWNVPTLRRKAVWRSLPRLRQASLVAARKAEKLHEVEAVDLLQHYATFQENTTCQQEAYAAGTFQQFEAWLKASVTSSPQPSPQQKALQDALIKNARTWKKYDSTSDRVAQATVLSIVLVTLVFTVLVVIGANGLLDYFTSGPLQKWAARYGLNSASAADRAFLAPLIALIIGLTVVWSAILQRFLRRFLGDALLWATYRETDENYVRRAAILARARGVLRQVLLKVDNAVHPAALYDRVIVIAHSLGSVIAHDALLQLVYDQDLDGHRSRIKHFITYGSPIDKFAYFFEPLQAETPGYERIVDNLRGSVFDADAYGTALKWQNFHEDGDAISGPVYTGTPPQDLCNVMNVYTANALTPALASNHGWYSRNMTVITYLWNVIIPGSIRRFTSDGTDDKRHMLRMKILQFFQLLISWALLGAYAFHGVHLLHQHATLIHYLWLCTALVIVLAVTHFFPKLNPLHTSVVGVILLVLLAGLAPPDESRFRFLGLDLNNPWISFGLVAGFVLICESVAWLVASYSKQNWLAAFVTTRGTLTLGVIVGLLVISSIFYQTVPIWWWRNAFLSATLVLMVVTGAQVLYGLSASGKTKNIF